MCGQDRHVQPCDCGKLQRPMRATWFATGKLHFELGRPLALHYPAAYRGGYVYAEQCARADRLMQPLKRDAGAGIVNVRPQA